MEQPVWLTRTLVETLQREQVREHGGKLGLRDEGLLESALARPRHRWSYDREADLAALAAEYGYGLAPNHAFFDGNKRLAFVAANVFLILNGYEIEAHEPVVVTTMLGVAAGRVGCDELAAWIRSVLGPCDLV